MGRMLLLLSIISLLILGIGTDKMPADSMFWLASGTLYFQIVRAILITSLLLQVFTSPPRRVKLRLLTGIVAAVVGIWTLQATLSFSMPILDTLAFLGSCVALMLTALERNNSLTNKAKSTYSTYVLGNKVLT